MNMKKILVLFIGLLFCLSPSAQTYNILDRNTTSAINTSSAATPTPPATLNGGLLSITSAPSNSSSIILDSYGNQNNIAGRRANGTPPSSLTALQAFENVLAIQTYGYGTTGYSTTNRASMVFSTTQIWTDTNQGTQIVFRTTPNNSAAVAVALVLDQDQSTRPQGRMIFTAATPAIGACGTSPSVIGSDNAMFITVGTGGAATSCAATFSGTGFPTNAPICASNSDTDIIGLKVVTTTTTITITATTPFTASSHLHVICMGRI